MMSMPTKIVLKSTTTMSLNERFSNMPKAPVQSPREKMASNTQASQANRRLALQMANRPTVQAALKREQGASGGDVRTRLGNINKGSVKARLTLPGRGRGRGRLMTRSPQRLGARGGATTRGARGARGALRGVRGAKTVRARGYKIRGGCVQRVQASTRGATARGGGAAPVRGMRGMGRGMRGRGRGRGGRGGGNRSKEQLDTDLDSYMSKSRAHLDAELDAYMASLD